MTLPEQIVDNGAADRNFRALDERIPVFSNFGQTLVDDADASAARDTLGLPTTAGTWFQVPHFGNGTSAAMTGGTLYYGQVVLPVDCTLTGINGLCVTASGGSVKGMLFSAAGAKLKDGTGTSLVDATPFKAPFSAGAYSAAAGVYFAAVIFSAASTMGNTLKQAPAGSSASGSYASPPSSISVPTAVASGPTIGTY